MENGIKQVIKDDRRIYYRDENTLVIEGKLSDFVYNSSQVLRDFTGKKTAVDNRKVSLVDETLKDTIAWYRENGWIK